MNTTETTNFITKEIAGLVKKEGLNGSNVLKRVDQLKKQGYVVVQNRSPKRTYAWRVYEV
jgi:biotin operon repressor